MAVGGNGGAASSGPGGLGGNAIASATAVGPAAANSTATADGGNGSLRSFFGSGVATASSTGVSGTAAANALSAGGMLINLEAHSSSPVSGLTRSAARAGIATTPMDADSAAGTEAAAFTSGLPSDVQAAAFFNGNVDVRRNFNLASDPLAGPKSDVFGLVTMGGSYSEGGASNRIYTSSVNYAIDLGALTNPRQNLLVGLLDTRVEGTGFDSLNFQITRENVAVVNETFTDVTEAVEYFNNATLDLGSNAPANVSGNLDLVFSLSLTTNDAGAGFYFDLLFGNSTLGSGFLPGDFDNSGAVGNADLTLLLDNWGEDVPPTPAGWLGIAPTAPGVGNDELTALLDGWGDTLSGSGAFSAAAVPEPNAVLLAIFAAIFGLPMGARFRRCP
jgi:hypothetical protein